MKIYALSLLMLFASSAFAQDFANNKTRTDYSASEQANFAAGELIKYLNIHDRSEYSNVLKVCDQYYLAMSMDEIRANPEECAKAQASMDKEIKRIVGSGQMNSYSEWKGKAKYYENVDSSED
jgi:hypothetical protein